MQQHNNIEPEPVKSAKTKVLAAKCSRFACPRGRRIKSCSFIAIKDTMAGLFSFYVLHFIRHVSTHSKEVDGGMLLVNLSCS